MPATSAATEFRKMQVSDLQRDTADLQKKVAKMRMGLALRSEKNSAEYRREKRSIARMMTVLKEKEMELKPAAKASKVPASSK